MAPANRASSPQAQRGAAAVFAAIALVTLLSALTLAIDVGRLYTAQRQLQQLADLAAIDGARVQSQCLGAAGLDEVTAEVRGSLARNQGGQGITPQALLGRRQAGANGLQRFAASAPGQSADSVQVVLSRVSPARILPLFAGDATRTLHARAAAQATWVASARLGLPLGTGADPVFLNHFYGGLLGGNLALTGDQYRAAAEASVSVSTLINARVEAGQALPDLQQAEPVFGLLSQIAELLNDTGDTAAATAVQAFATAVAAGRPAAEVVPAEALGLPPDTVTDSYDGVTASVGDVLNAVAGAVSDGEPITIPDLNLPPPLGDTSITVRIPQAGKPGSFMPGSEQIEVSNSDSVFTSAGLVQVRTRLVDPISGVPFELPLLIVLQPAAARVTGLACARLGQQAHQARVSAQGPVMRFALGHSSDFNSGAGDLLAALGNVLPADLITLTLLGQPVTIQVQAGPYVFGDAAPETLCLQGPPWGAAVQCDGASAAVGGFSSEQAADYLGANLGDVRLRATLPGGLPLNGLLQGLVNDRLATLTEVTQPAMRLLAAQLLPVLQSVNLVAGATPVMVQGVTVIQPEVYAQ